MKILSLVQGSPEWLAARSKYRTASEASAMMGVHKTTKRNELLHMKATGTAKEYSDWTQRELFDKGHIVEALARPIAEGITDEILFPITAVDDADYLLASFDGRTEGMGGIYTDESELIWECKSWNEAKAAIVENDDTCPEEDLWQVVQQLVVSRAKHAMYMVTDGTLEKTVYTWITLTDELEKALMAGWAQFDIDLANYVPREIKQAPVGETVKDLPAVTVHVKGELTHCNLTEIIPQFDTFIAGAITEFKTDNDFANAEKQAKVARATAKKCDEVAQSVIDQMLTVSEAILTLREYRDKFNALGLQQEKAVASEKKRIKEKIIADSKADFSSFLEALKAEVSPVRLIVVTPDFAGAVKNKRTLESLYNAVDSEVASAKIKANEIAQQLRANLKTLNEDASEYPFLFNDLQDIVYADSGAFSAIVEIRVSKYKRDEDQRVADVRAQIALEEEAKAREKVAAEALAKAQAEMVTELPTEPEPLPIRELSEVRPLSRVASLSEPEFMPLDYARTVTSQELLNHANSIFGLKELNAMRFDQNNVEYELQVTIKRFSIKSRKVA